MAVQSVAATSDPDQSIHQVCQGENCTTFMVSENSVIGFGMGEGFKDRLAAYRTETGITSTLKYVIAADHHDEDIGGAAEATEAGATLLITDQTANKLQDSEDNHKVEVITEAWAFGDISVMPMATDHAASVLTAYHKSQKMFMQTGYYFSPFINGPSYARRTATSLYEAIPGEIKVEAVSIISGEDMKPEKWSDFQAAIDAFDGIHCHRNRPICRL